MHSCNFYGQFVKIMVLNSKQYQDKIELRLRWGIEVILINNIYYEHDTLCDFFVIRVGH